MPIEITADTKPETVLELLRKYWGLPKPLSTAIKCDDPANLHMDIAQVVAFLSRRAEVLEALKGLDTAIELELAKAERAELRKKVETATKTFQGDGLRSKTGKLLSGVLDAFEFKHGFNAVSTSKLHTTAQFTGDADDRETVVAFTNKNATWTQHNPEGEKDFTKLKTVQLPQGAPTLTGILLKSFNPILLKHGYHWKDPGADALVHGEFTHRIQWYAICSRPNLFKNKPIQIFKSMGFDSFARSVNPEDPTSKTNGSLYLWTLCCDNFAPDQAKSLPGQPFTKTTFNCPNFLQTYLSKPMGQAMWKELPYLKALMAGRFVKRSGEARTKTGDLIESGTKQVHFGVSSEPGKGDEAGAGIWWRTRLPRQ